MPPGIADIFAEHWSEIQPFLRDSDLDLIGDLARRADARRDRAAGDDEHALRATVQNLRDLLVIRLPAGHPVREAIFVQTRLSPTPTDWAAVGEVLRDLTARQEVLSHAIADAREDLSRRLLEAPAVEAGQAKRLSAGSYRDDLVCLQRDDGSAWLPAFQVGPDGEPIQVVREINRILGASEDPWGVADWWLGRNAWLDAVPADLLGRGLDDRLTQAALAEFLDG